jgi:hypothetical protein
MSDIDESHDSSHLLQQQVEEGELTLAPTGEDSPHHTKTIARDRSFVSPETLHTSYSEAMGYPDKDIKALKSLLGLLA